MNPTEIQCTACDDTQTIYSCRAGKSLAVGIPVKCPTKHECRRHAYAILEAVGRDINETTWTDNADPIDDIARAADFILNQPYSASGEVARYLKEFYNKRCPVSLINERISPLSEDYITGVAEGMWPPVLSDAEIEGMQTRHLMNSIYRNIVRGRAYDHWLKHFYDGPLSVPFEDLTNAYALIKTNLHGRGVKVTSEMIYDLQYKTEMGETT